MRLKQLLRFILPFLKHKFAHVRKARNDKNIVRGILNTLRKRLNQSPNSACHWRFSDESPFLLVVFQIEGASNFRTRILNFFHRFWDGRNVGHRKSDIQINFKVMERVYVSGAVVFVLLFFYLGRFRWLNRWHHELLFGFLRSFESHFWFRGSSCERIGEFQPLVGLCLFNNRLFSFFYIFLTVSVVNVRNQADRAGSTLIQFVRALFQLLEPHIDSICYLFVSLKNRSIAFLKSN